MKKTSFTFLLSLMVVLAWGQGTLDKGGMQLNAGLGFSSWGTPIYIGADYGVHEAITIGPKISYRKYSSNHLFGEYSQSLIVIGFNGNYHFNSLLKLPDPWDLYAGLTLGYYIWSDVTWENSTYDFRGRSSGLGLDAQIGARYFFTEKFGVNLELGGGTAAGGGIGVTFKL